MKLESKFFDSIRVGTNRKRAEDEKKKRQPMCQWQGCDKPAGHRAPKGRGHDGEFFMFCTDHVREYNASYNYFDGMNDGQVADFVKDAATGHRPTWKVGANSWAHGTRHKKEGGEDAGSAAGNDSAAYFAWRAKQARSQPVESRRQFRPLEKKAMQTLELEPGAGKDEIKARFKDLVKRHHPDANGGDTRSEERLREIIQAYNYLKQAGLV